MGNSYANSSEMREMAIVMDALNDLQSKLDTRESGISFGDVSIFDVNGDDIGKVSYRDGVHVYIGVQ